MNDFVPREVSHTFLEIQVKSGYDFKKSGSATLHVEGTEVSGGLKGIHKNYHLRQDFNL